MWGVKKNRWGVGCRTPPEKTLVEHCSIFFKDFRFKKKDLRRSARSAVSESINRYLRRVSVWCNLWGMKLNASKTKTMIVSRSRTVHPQLTPLTLDRAVLKESADLGLLGVTFDGKMTFEKHLRSVSSAAAQSLVS